MAVSLLLAPAIHQAPTCFQAGASRSFLPMAGISGYFPAGALNETDHFEL